MNYIVSVPAFFSIPKTGGQVRCTLSWSIPVHLYLLGIFIPKFSLYFFIGLGLPLVPLWLFIFWGLCEKISLSLCVILFFLSLPMGKFRCVFESGCIVDSLGDLSGVIILWTGFLKLWYQFLVSSNFWYHMDMCFWCILFYCPNIHFWLFSFFLV